MIHFFRYFLRIIFILNTCLLYSQPEKGKPGSKGTYETQEYYNVLRDSSSIKEGPFELWYEGVKIISGQYSNNKKEGLWKFSNITDDVYYHGTFSQNKKNGSWKYFRNKKPLCRIYYKNDMKDSLWQSFYENGETQCNVSYSDNRRNGPFKLFYENGNVMVEKTFKYDTIVGNYITYFEGNIIKSNIEYKSGNPYNVIQMNDSLGNPADFGTIKNGTGTLKVYRVDGKIISETNYEDGVKNGIEKKHMPSLGRRSEQNYNAGLEDGEYRNYYENGQIDIKGEYKKGKQTGNWIYYNKNGAVFATYNADKDSVNNSSDILKVLENQIFNAENNYVVTEIMPQSQGNEAGLNEFLMRNVNYPQRSKEKHISGTVYISFIINSIGKLQDVTLFRGVTEELDKEAVRMIYKMPPWTPGFSNGFPVNVRYNLPVNFMLK